MKRRCAAIVVAGLRGGSGKTLFTLGLLSCWREQGRSIVPFKKGPDYIDAAWLRWAAGVPCYNLDPYLMPREQIVGSFLRRTQGVHGAVVEGNRGLYDGVDAQGTYSTAELAKVLRVPVVVVMEATKTTRTAAAMILGLRQLDPEVDLRGVILNQVAGGRHESVLRQSIERYSGVRVLGALPRLRGISFPERHLGLVPPEEHGSQDEVIRVAADAVRSHVDLEALWEAARACGELPALHLYRGKPGGRVQCRVGVVQDEGFHFYYPENIEALEEHGAEVVSFSALNQRRLPQVDALYIGGGFPEVYVQRLADNATLRADIRSAVEDGLPVYAECGGLMYLGNRLRVRGREYPMVGALPLVTEFTERPQGHGYTGLEAVAGNPFFPVGYRLKGHEFHYSRIVALDESQVEFGFRVERGSGLDGRREGIVRKGVLGTYTHIHALGCDAWPQGLVRQATQRRGERGIPVTAGNAMC
jgi:cobyrinic acid a,c-diamide synthase